MGLKFWLLLGTFSDIGFIRLANRADQISWYYNWNSNLILVEKLELCFHLNAGISRVNRKYQLQNYHFQGRRIKPRFILHKLFAISNCDVKYWSFADCINIQYWSLSQSLVLSRNASISLGKEKKSTSSNLSFLWLGWDSYTEAIRNDNDFQVFWKVSCFPWIDKIV